MFIISFISSKNQFKVFHIFVVVWFTMCLMYQWFDGSFHYIKLQNLYVDIMQFNYASLLSSEIKLFKLYN